MPTTHNHTPTPWTVQHFNDEPTACICAGEGDIRVLTLEANCSDAEHDANAAFIVRACNSHDELLAAVKAMVAVLHLDSDMEEDFADEIEQATKAIAHAEGSN